MNSTHLTKQKIKIGTSWVTRDVRNIRNLTDPSQQIAGTVTLDGHRCFVFGVSPLGSAKSVDEVSFWKVPAGWAHLVAGAR